MSCVCKCRWPKWPLTRKCCFCVPIRRGVIIFAYANLVFNLLSMPILIFLLVDHAASNHKGHTKGNPVTQLAVTIGFMCVDVMLIITLLVGAHRKNKRLLQTYFYLGVGFQIFTVCLDILSFEYGNMEENMVYLFFLSLNVYQLFLVYNTIHMIEENKEVRYVVYQE